MDQEGSLVGSGFQSFGWKPANVGSSCAGSLHSLMWDAAGSGRHRRRTDVDGTEYADVQAELGGAARAVRWCGSIDSQSDTDATMPDPHSPFEPLPPVRWAAETGWPDFPNAVTLHFQKVENPHQLNTLSSDSLQGSARMLTCLPLPLEVSPLRKSRPSRVSSLRAKRWQLRQKVCSGPATYLALRLVLQCLARQVSSV